MNDIDDCQSDVIPFVVRLYMDGVEKECRTLYVPPERNLRYSYTKRETIDPPLIGPALPPGIPSPA